MKNHMRIFSVALTALLLSAAAQLALADPDWGARGPGMMGGYGPGYGMGQGMMGGYGPGSGMGQGMMGGYGPGSGMGAGMMGGGMGHGMMGYGDYRELGLNAEQKTKITQIRKNVRNKHLELMDDMMEAQDKLQELYDADKQDAAAINKQYKVIEDVRRQMVDSSVEANNQINAILTKEQREKLRERNRGYGPMMRGY